MSQATKPHGRVAIVTGAGTGIGRASALALLGDGYRVALAGRRTVTLDEVVRDAGERGRDALVVAADVGEPRSVEALFRKTVEIFGRLDLLFNNAGINVPSVPVEELRFDEWQSVVATNLTGVFLCTQQAFRIMKRQSPRGGRIINNGSISAYVPRPDSAAYTATKHGVTGLTRSTSLDGRKYDIACGQIDVGNARTELAERTSTAEPMMDVVEVAKAVLYMANLPLDANVQFMTVMATKMPFIGRG